MTPIIVSVHSRKGGVGKTSLAVSAAFQLAARGKKVALLDLDTLGTHLSQCLPTDRDTLGRQNDELLEFRPDAFERETEDKDKKKSQPGYYDRSYLTWQFAGTPTGEAPPTIDEIEAHVNFGMSSWENARKRGVEREFDNIEKNLMVFPGSCIVRDIINANDEIIRGENPVPRYARFLGRVATYLSKYRVEFAFIDNSPGLSFFSGTQLAAVLKIVNSSNMTASWRTWFVTGPAWWEQGIVLYEIRTYAGELRKTRPTLVVNKAPGAWLGQEGFAPGKSISIQDADNNGLLARLFDLPIFAATGKSGEDLSNVFLINRNISFAVLGEDYNLRNIVIKPEDRGEIALLKHKERNIRWAETASEYASEFALGAISAIGKEVRTEDEIREQEIRDVKLREAGLVIRKNSFHRDIHTALLEPLLQATS
ncbi:MAG: ParA family protein [Phycisphaerales bacterium]|nr:ParA family protein [Phycisphaerales bacterium]